MTTPKPYAIVPLVATGKQRDEMFSAGSVAEGYTNALAARPASYIALEAAWEELRIVAEIFLPILQRQIASIPPAPISVAWQTAITKVSRLQDAFTALAEAEAAVKKEVG